MANTDRQTIAQYIKQWVDGNTNPHFAVLLDGPWGSGKTHFIKHMDDYVSIDRKAIYVSLFGISSIEALQSAIFFAGATHVGKGVRYTAGIAGAVLKAVRIDMNSDGNDDVQIEGQFKGLNSFVEQKAKIIDDSLLIFDDLERCKIPMEELLGTLNNWIEHSNARVLILANTDEIKEDRFKSFQEKIIGQSFKLEADTETALDAFIAEISVPQIQQKVRSQTATILDLHKKSTYHNLRALRQFIYFLTQIFEKLDTEYLENEALLKELIFVCFFGFIEFKLNPCKNAQALSPADLVYNGDTYGQDLVFNFFEEYVYEEEQPYRNLVARKYAYGGFSSVISLSILSKFLETGLIDRDTLNASIMLPEDQTIPSWQRLWWLGKADLDEARLVKGKLSAGIYTDIYEFMHIAGIAIRFAKNGLWGKSTIRTVVEFENYITHKFIPSLNWKNHHHVDFSLDSGAYGLGYIEVESTEFQKIHDHLQNEWRKWRSNQLKIYVSQQLMTMLPNDFEKFVISLTGHSNPDFQLGKDAVLHFIAPKKFTQKWLELPREFEQILPRELKAHGLNSEVAQLEAPWWGEVKAELIKIRDRKIKARKTRPRGLQITSLINAIEEHKLDQPPT